MTKVASSKKKPKPQVVEQDKSSLKSKKKMGSEIDEIFAGKKRKKLEKENKGEDEKPAKVLAATTNSLDKKKIGKSCKSNSFEENSSADRTCRPRKKTVDGLPIYAEEELGVGKPGAGGTTLCPFDCDCCF